MDHFAAHPNSFILICLTTLNTLIECKTTAQYQNIPIPLTSIIFVLIYIFNSNFNICKNNFIDIKIYFKLIIKFLKNFNKKLSSNFRSNDSNHFKAAWTNAEIQALKRAFPDYFSNKKAAVPGFKDIIPFLEKNAVLFKGRNKASVKTWLHGNRNR